MYASKNPQESYSKFLNEILFVYNKSFPLIKKLRAKKHKPWITMGFRHSIRTKNKLYKYYLNKPTVFNEINYKQYRNKLNCLVNIAEKAYYQHELHKHKGNLKNTWKIVKGIIRKKEVVTTIEQLLIEDKLTKNKQHIADKFNEYFTNIGPQLAEKIPFVQGSPNQYLKGVYRNSMFLLPATSDEIRGIINNLNKF